MDNTYNGWTNYETWNVALYIQNEYGLYQMAKRCEDYSHLVEIITEVSSQATPDGVSWTDPKLDIDELNEMMVELRDPEA